MESQKTIGALTIAASTAGFYLGAGYLSGQELWQFFGVYGAWGLIGMALAIAAIAALGTMLFRVAQLSGESEFDRVAIRFDIPWLRRAFCCVEIFFTFCVFVIMSAGGGALIEQMTGLSGAMGSAVFCAVVAVTALKGVKGMLNAFSLLVPVLTAITILIAILAASMNAGSPIVLVPQPVSNPLLGNWLFSSLTYLSYNFFGAVCVFAPIAHLCDMKDVRRGSLIAGAALIAIAFAVLLSIAMFPSSASAQLPMLAVASAIGQGLGYLCAVPLLFGMFGTSLSSLVAVIEYGELRYAKLGRRRAAVVFLLSILAWVCSLAGFGELVSVLYPICGYVGFFAIALILEHLIYLKRNQK